MRTDTIKAVILAGGKGTRLHEKTSKIPKPLIEIDGKPIIWHIMKIYSHYGINNFILCLGYKGDLIKEYMEMENEEGWDIVYANTGLETGTAGRVKKIKKHLNNTFCLTYGDGIANIDISDLLNFHADHGRTATITAVRPLIRFGFLELNGNVVNKFSKDSQPTKGWIDGGFFVLKDEIFKNLENIRDTDMLEGAILDDLAKRQELIAYRHRGYWRCIDTLRDLQLINKEIELGKDEWKVWKQ